MQKIKITGRPDFLKYDQTLMFSMETPGKGTIEVKKEKGLRQDTLIEGNPNVLAAGLHQQMERHPALAEIILKAATLYLKQ